MLHPAQQYLKLRSLGAPAVLLSLAMQGVFRGFKDTTTPLYATGIYVFTNLNCNLPLSDSNYYFFIVI
jgi:Na+-driven multidrug efflux pump